MKFLILLCSMLLVACANTPPSFVLAPGLEEAQLNNGLSNEISVVDNRTHSNVLSITNSDGKITWVKNTHSPSDVISSALAQALKVKGNRQSYQVTINRLDIKVKQDVLKFTSNSEISLTVHTTQLAKQISKTFKRSGNRFGPFNADTALLEQDFNLLLGKLLTEIANDPELINSSNQYNN